MRRYLRSVVFILFLVTVSSLALGFQTINVGNLERGGDTILGLKLGLDLQGGSDLRYQAALKDPETGDPITPTPDQMESLRSTIERRVNASGLGKPIIQVLGSDRLLIQLPGVRDITRAKALIGETARLEWRHRTFDVDRPLPGVTQNEVLDVSVIDLVEFHDQSSPSESATTTDRGGATGLSRPGPHSCFGCCAAAAAQRPALRQPCAGGSCLGMPRGNAG